MWIKAAGVPYAITSIHPDLPVVFAHTINASTIVYMCIYIFHTRQTSTYSTDAQVAFKRRPGSFESKIIFFLFPFSPLPYPLLPFYYHDASSLMPHHIHDLWTDWGLYFHLPSEFFAFTVTITDVWSHSDTLYILFLVPKAIHKPLTFNQIVKGEITRVKPAHSNNSSNTVEEKTILLIFVLICFCNSLQHKETKDTAFTHYIHTSWRRKRNWYKLLVVM